MTKNNIYDISHYEIKSHNHKIQTLNYDIKSLNNDVKLIYDINSQS